MFLSAVKRRAANLLLIAFGLLVAFALLEGGTRLWFSQFGTERQRVLYTYDWPTIRQKTAQLAGLPYLNYGLNPGWEGVNARGVRGKLVDIPKPDGVYRIVTLGGSTTFGHALPVEETWAAQLEMRLREDFAGVEVVNLGTPGYHTLESVVNFATRGLTYEPDMVIVYHGINDAVVRMFADPACYTGDTALLGFGIDRGIWQYETARLPSSTLYRMFAYQTGRLPDPADFTTRLELTDLCPKTPPQLSAADTLRANLPVYFERNLRNIVAMGEAHNVEVVLSTFAWHVAAAEASLAADPEQYQLEAMLVGITQQNEIIRQLAAAEGLVLLDPADELGAEAAYWQNDRVHQSPAGARAQAQLYAAQLREVIAAAF